MAERILVLEGPKGTAIQSLELSEEDFRGDLLKDHPRDIRGDNDVLGLTRPDIVEAIHRDYLAAGAWILSTNTFNASPVSQAEYGLEHLVYDMNRAAAENARRALDGAEDRFVVGSVGPTNRTLSISPKVEDPAYRTITFDQLTEAYAEQIRGLVDGGVDVLQIETIFDTLNAKAAVAAAQDVAPDVPLWLSFTAVDQSGRNLSGQTAEAFWLSIEHAEPLIVGVNCSLGAAQMRPYLEALSRIAPTYTACYPNAGLPNAFGLHDEDPEITSSYVGEFARAGLANILGGCCGTTPEHIRQIARGDLGPSAAGGPRPRRDVHLVQRSRAVRRPARYGLRDGGRTPEHHGLEEVPASDRERRLPGGRRHRAGAGPERRQPARRQHGHRPARRPRVDDDVPEPPRHGARGGAGADHGGLVQLGRDRGRPEMRAGQGCRELDQPQGGRGGLPRQGPASQALRRRGRRDGLRRAGSGRHRQAQGRDLRAGVSGAHRAGRLRPIGHHLRPEHPGDRDRDGGARGLRARVHRCDPHHQATSARA